MKKQSIIALAIAMLLFGTSLTSELLAQGKGNRKERGNRGKGECIHTAKRDSMRCVMQNEVIPELQKIKEDFDAKLSRNDLEELNTLRSAAASIRAEALSNAPQRNDRRGSRMTEEEKEAFKSRRMEHKNRMDAIHNDLKSLIERNTTQVDLLTRSLEELAEKNGAARFLQGPRPNNRDIRKNRNNDDETKTPIRRQIGTTRTIAERFLLWNGMANTIDDAFENANTQANVTNNPNPFTEKTNINFVLPQNGNVTIDLYDNSGNHLGQIFNGNLSQGRNSIEFSASSIKNLQPGVLMYKIKSNNFEQTGKMLYSR